MLQEKVNSIVFVFFGHLLGTQLAHTLWKFKGSYITLTMSAKPWEHSIALAILSIATVWLSWIKFSTCYTIDFIAIKTERPLRCSSWILQRPCENFSIHLYITHFYAINTSLHTQVTFLYECFLLKSFYSENRTTVGWSSTKQSSSTFASL